jgi:hypothetical protein
MQQAPMFPVFDNVDDMGRALQAMLGGETDTDGATLLSAEQISTEANLVRLVEQRRRFRRDCWSELADNHEHSVFYQLDLDDAARDFAAAGIPLPAELPVTQPLMKRINDAMFRSEVNRLAGRDHTADENRAFGLLREGLTETVLARKQNPRMSVYSDQIVWGRSPVRIDIAGGWTDTPPFCLTEGGNVINLAIELNGQPPLQTYVRPCREHHIVLRSIDLGAVEVIDTYEQLADFTHVGSPFSIPKAALVLAGFQRRAIPVAPCAARGFRLRNRADPAVGHSRRQRARHEQHPCSHGARSGERLLLSGVGQGRDWQADACARAAAHHRRRLARPVRRSAARRETVADRPRI